MNHLEKAKYRHSGLSHTRIDNIYKTIKSRCYTDTNHKYKNYGARGIRVCDEWLEDKRSFFKWAFENGYREDLSIDRIDNDGNYCPENCRWVDILTQENNRSSNVHIEYGGTDYTLAQFCREFNLKYKLFHKKYRTDMLPLEVAIEASRRF